MPTAPSPMPSGQAAEAGPLPEATLTAAGVRVLRGVPYASLDGVRPLELDLYLPAPQPDPPPDARAGARPGARPGAIADVRGCPAVVFLHGGGWRLGSRRSAGPAFSGVVSPFERMAAAGVAVASADYRLSGEATWPAQLHDAKAAVRWLRHRSGELGIDPDRIGAWGESAGGHLAALLGVTGTLDADAPLEGTVGVTGVASAVATVVAWYAPTDLVGLPGDLGADPAATDSREALLLGGAISERPDAAAEAGAVTHVHAGAPAYLLVHGEADRLVPCAQSTRLAEALEAVGVEVELVLEPGADHLWRGSDEAAEDALRRTVEHLTTRLGARPLRPLR